MKPLTTAKLDRRTTAASRQTRRLDTKVRDALELMTAASPSCPAPLLLAHGLKAEMLADLVRKGLATASTEPVNSGGRSVGVVRLKITEAGRQALWRADSGRCRPRFRNDVVRRSEMVSPTIPG
jgi:hypothetical protein